MHWKYRIGELLSRLTKKKERNILKRINKIQVINIGTLREYYSLFSLKLMHLTESNSTLHQVQGDLWWKSLASIWLRPGSKLSRQAIWKETTCGKIPKIQIIPSRMLCNINPPSSPSWELSHLIFSSCLFFFFREILRCFPTS